VEYIVKFKFSSVIVKLIKFSQLLKIRSVKLAYKGAARGRTFFIVGRFLLTRSLLMSYIYGAPCKARNFNVVYTGCNRRNGPNFGRVFLMLNYTEKTQHLYPKLNGLVDNGQWSLKLWQLLHTYWLPNSYSNGQEYVVSIMLISVLNIKVTCEWHKAIKLNQKNSHYCRMCP
jgi:hypothetical protein